MKHPPLRRGTTGRDGTSRGDDGIADSSGHGWGARHRKGNLSEICRGGLARGLARRGVYGCMRGRGGDQGIGRISVLWHADVGDPVGVEGAVAGLVGSRGNIEALVSNAAIINRGTLESLSLEEWDEQIRINLTGSFLITRAVAPHMQRARRGSIVHVSSITGTHGGDNRVGYVASKGGILAMSMSVALDLAPYGIRVNAVAPGTVATRLTRPALSDPSRAPKILAGIPLGRAAEPEDIAGVIHFLCTEDARYMTGSVVTVDGGISASP